MCRRLGRIVLVRLSVARTGARWTAAAALEAGIVWGYTHSIRANPTTVALTFLLLIQWLAAYWGLGLAAAASVGAALCFNYFFLPPVGTFTIAETQNWVALAAFLATALIGSNLAGRLQAARAASERRGLELELLYDLGQRLLGPQSSAELLHALPWAIAAALKCKGSAVYLVEGAEVHATSLTLELPLGDLQAAARATAPFAGPAAGSVLLPLAVGVRPVGAIYLESESEGVFPAARGLPSAETLEAMSSLVALSLERASAVGKLVHAEAAAESDRLRATLLDAVTHDLRTPLTSIKAAVTSLLSQGGLRADQREELLTVIDEESDRLNRLIAEAMEMAELEARSVRLDRHMCALGPLFAEVLEVARERWPERVVSLTGDARAFVDAGLVRKVLLHLVENAAKYSTTGGAIYVAVTGRSRWVEVAVGDEGPGIAEAEQVRIFDKFYRNEKERYRVKGSGMGLPIARAIVEAHGGRLTVESEVGEGSVFRFTLPRVG